MKDKTETEQTAKATPKGEVFVWITGMGLAIGLLMIFALLWVVLKNGIVVFWPSSVAQIELREDRDSTFRGGTTAAGVILEEYDRDVRDLTEEQLESPDQRDRRQIRFFSGNRDAYGQAFAYLMLGDIAEKTYPPEIVRAERMEWGDAIFFPLRLELADGTQIDAEDPDFRKRLRELVDEVRDRRQVINRIERREIGRINLEMRSIEQDLRYLGGMEERTEAQEREWERLTHRLEELRGDFAPLEARAQELRATNRENRLHFRLVTGEERSHHLGEIVNFYYPNDMSLVAKVGLFFFHIWEFLSGYPREANTEGGIFPAIFGTFVMTLLMSVAVTPFGVLAAIYLREYARQGPMVRAVRIAINNLAGVPSIVFGVFGLGFFILFVGNWVDVLFYPRSVETNTPMFGTGGILWASLTLALMTVPVVIVATEEALAAVSRGVREGSLACGASKWQTIQNLVLPASLPGILTGLILAMARGAGEVAPLMLVGVVALAPNLPLDTVFPFFHLERKFMHLGFHIYDLGFQSPDSEAAQPMVFATTLVLILLVILLNLGAILIRNHIRKKYAASAF